MLLETQHLSVGYGRKVIQHHLDLSVPESALICLVGTNGAGKSTLLRTIAGLQPPLDGTVLIDGHDIRHLAPRDKARLLSVVLTEKIEIENMTVRQLVAMGRFPYTNWIGTLSETDNEIIDRALRNVNLHHKADANINQISDGEKQRAVIAKALAQDTPLILLDEPTAHLDLPNRIETMLLLRRLSVATKKTFILSTHELDMALQTADQIWLMTTAGIQTGIPEDLMLEGTFQKAFNSANYTFDPRDGHCVITPIYGNLAVKITASDHTDDRRTWLQHALTRTGIITTEHSTTHIHCTPEGYRLTINDTTTDNTYHTIQQLLSELNNTDTNR